MSPSRPRAAANKQPRRTRRSLLKCAIAAAAAPFAISRGVLAAGRSPSNRIALGIIGVRKMGGAHLDALLPRSDVVVAAVCDVDAVVREAARARVHRTYAAAQRAATWTGCDACVEYEKLLARDDLDAVLIATPDHWHARIALDACRAGKDVYCEKPLSLTVREGRAMVDAARRFGRVFQTGSQQRSMPEFRRACELVRSGVIGRLTSVHVEVGPPSDHIELPAETAPSGLDYDRWLGPAPWAPFHRLRVGPNYWDGWRKHIAYSGGKMTDWGAHHYDIAQWALDADATGPVEIVPPPAACVWPRPRWEARDPSGPGATPDDPSWGLEMRYANGVRVIKDGARGVRFVGEDGWIEVDRGWLTAEPRAVLAARLRPGDARLPQSPGHHDDWLACIRTRRRPIADVEVGCRSATVCHLGNIALWLGRTIRWDPRTEQIVGDPAAARWLDRPKRAPYAG